MHSPSLPTTVTPPDASLPSTRSRWCGSRLHGYYQGCDFPPPFSPCLVSFARRYQVARRGFAPAVPNATTAGLECVGFGHSLNADFIRRRRRDLPSSWGTPIAPLPGSSTPVGRWHLTRAVRPQAPVGGTTRAHTWKLSSSIAGLGPRCLRFAALVAHGCARLASGCWLGPPGRACLPTRFHERFPSVSTSLPPFPSLLGAIPFIPHASRFVTTKLEVEVRVLSFRA